MVGYVVCVFVWVLMGYLRVLFMVEGVYIVMRLLCVFGGLFIIYGRVCCCVRLLCLCGGMFVRGCLFAISVFVLVVCHHHLVMFHYHLVVWFFCFGCFV